MNQDNIKRLQNRPPILLGRVVILFDCKISSSCSSGNGKYYTTLYYRAKMLNLLLKTMFLEDSNISCKLSYICVEIYVLGVTIYSGVYDTPQINMIEILLSHLYTTLAHFALAFKTPQESIMLLFHRKIKLWRYVPKISSLAQNPIPAPNSRSNPPGTTPFETNHIIVPVQLLAFCKKHNIIYDNAFLRCGLERKIK